MPKPGTEKLFAPIYCLPNELLVEIFYLCRYQPRTQIPSKQGLPHVSGSNNGSLDNIFFDTRVALSQVCRQWRQVTLNTPRLWSVIYLDAPTFTIKCFAERARGVLLHLKLLPLFYLDKQKMRLLVNPELIGRTASIEYNSYGGEEQYEEDEGEENEGDKGLGGITVSLAAPNLRSFRFVINTNSNSVGDTQRPRPFSFEDCRFSSLRTLELENSFTDIPECLMGHTLTTLILRSDDLILRSIEFHVLAYSLSQMSQLEVLELVGIHFLDSDCQGTVCLSPMTFQNLRQIVLELPPVHEHSTVLHYMGLLEALNPVQPLNQFNLNFAACRIPDIISQYLSTISRYLRPLTLCGLTFYDLPVDSLNACFFTFHQASVNPMAANTPVEILLPSSSSTLDSVWNDFLAPLNLDCLQTLEIGDLPINASDLCERLLLRCIDLKRLSLVGDHKLRLVDLLGHSKAVALKLESIYLAHLVCEMDTIAAKVGVMVKNRVGTLQEINIDSNCENMDAERLMAIAGCGVQIDTL